MSKPKTFTYVSVAIYGSLGCLYYNNYDKTTNSKSIETINRRKNVVNLCIQIRHLHKN